MISQTFIKKIIQLSNGNSRDQLKADREICNKIFPDGVCVDTNVIPELLPIFVKFLNSKNSRLQKDTAYLIMAIVYPSADANTYNETKLLIETDGIISGLINLLSSPHSAVVEQSILSLGNLSYYFPEPIVKNGVLKPLFRCLNESSNDEDFTYAGAQLLKNLTFKCDSNIPEIIDFGGIQILQNFVGSNNRNICEESLQALINIISCNVSCCQKVVDFGILKFIKNLLNRVSSIKVLAVEFIVELTAYGEPQIDAAINEGFIQIILEQLKNGVGNSEIKIKFLNIIKNILHFKQKYFLSHLIQEENIISILLNNLQNSDDELIIFILTLINGIINTLGYGAIEQKFKRCGGKIRILNLLQHENVEIQGLATMINEFIENKPPLARKAIKLEKNEINVGAVKRKIENSQIQRSRNNKRCKLSISQDCTPTSEENLSNVLFSSPAKNNSIVPPSDPPKLIENVSNNSFSPFKYYNPSEFFIDSCCEKLGLKFDRQKYHEISSKIKITQICSTLKPANVLRTIDKSGFGCFSLFLTGEGKNAEKIREQIRIKYINDLDESKDLDKQKLIEICSTILTNAHFEIITEWWNCKIMIYSNNLWEIFGDWNSEDKTVPVFVLRKEKQENEIVYDIVSSLKES